MSRKAKRRTRTKLSILPPAEIAKITKLIEAAHQQTEQACLEVFDQEERERQVLLRQDHTAGPWPERLDAGATGDDGYVYVREGDKVNEVPAGHPFLREVARRDGMIRYAWNGGLTTDLDQSWSKIDPSWQYVMTRTRGVPPDGWDRAIRIAIKEVLKTGTPLGTITRAYLDDCVEVDPDPKRRERERDRALASVIDGLLGWLVELLVEAGYTDPKTRAEAYLAAHWRKIVRQDHGRWRFSGGPALAAWLRDQRGPTKNTPKISYHRGPLEPSNNK